MLKPRRRPIPSWFNIEKYADAIRLDTSGWCNELFRRLYGTEDSDIPHLKYPPYGLLPKELRGNSGQYVTHDVGDPLTDLPSVKSLRHADVMAFILSQLCDFREKYSPEECDIISKDIQAGLYNQPFDEFRLHKLKGKADAIESEHRDSWLWIRARTQKHVYIDLAASDKQIFDDFEI
jgi:hypothetical protein